MSVHAGHLDIKILSIFSVVGSYFVDVLFNHVYASVCSHMPPGASITDEYRRQIQTYIICVKNDKDSYMKVIQGVRHYFAATTCYTTMTYAEFVNRIIEACIPSDYFELLSDPEKDEILGDIICELLVSLAIHATSVEMLRRIIDEHNNEPSVTIKMLQDHSVKLLTIKRERLHNLFLKKAIQAREQVSVEAVSEVIRKLVKEKAELIHRIQKLEETLSLLQQKFILSQDVQFELRETIRLLTLESKKPSFKEVDQAGLSAVPIDINDVINKNNSDSSQMASNLSPISKDIVYHHNEHERKIDLAPEQILEDNNDFSAKGITLPPSDEYTEHRVSNSYDSGSESDMRSSDEEGSVDNCNTQNLYSSEDSEASIKAQNFSELTVRPPGPLTGWIKKVNE